MHLHRAIACVVIIALTALSIDAARADNPTITQALAGRADLSDFYRTMVTTGVAADLQPDADYTIFFSRQTTPPSTT